METSLYEGKWNDCDERLYPEKFVEKYDLGCEIEPAEKARRTAKGRFVLPKKWKLLFSPGEVLRDCDGRHCVHNTGGKHISHLDFDRPLEEWNSQAEVTFEAANFEEAVGIALRTMQERVKSVIKVPKGHVLTKQWFALETSGF